EIVGIRAYERTELGARLRQEVVDTPAQELHRLRLQLPLPCLAGIEHGLRAGAEAAVIQEGHIGPQKELLMDARPRQRERGIAHSPVIRDYAKVTKVGRRMRPPCFIFLLLSGQAGAGREGAARSPWRSRPGGCGAPPWPAAPEPAWRRVGLGEP